MTTNTILKQNLLDSISANTGIKDITVSSKINSLVDAFVNELSTIDEGIDTTLNNMYIQTCEESYLDKIGSQEGLSRITNNSFYIDKATAVTQIETTSDTPLTGTISKGTYAALNEVLYVVFKEDIDLTVITKLNPMLVSLEVRVSGTGSLDIPVNTAYNIFTDNLHLRFNEGLSIPLITETVEDYRSRVMFSRASSKFGSENAIRLSIGSTNYVSDHSIDYTTTPPTIFLFHTNLLINETFNEDIQVFGINTIKTELNKRKADTTSYDIALPVKVNLRINITSKIPTPREIPSEIYSLTNYIANTYKLGSEYSISVQLIKDYMISLGYSIDFLEDYSVELKQVLNNYEYDTIDNEITLSSYEYPFLERILLMN